MSRVKVPSWNNIRGKPDFDALYQEILVSGDNLRTINGQSLLGSTDLVIGGGSLTVREVDGTPSGVATEIVFPNGTVSLASGVATIAMPFLPIDGGELEGGLNLGGNGISDVGELYANEIFQGGVQVVVTNDARLSDARTPTAHNHDAAAINAGTLDDARLSANVPRLNAANTFTQTIDVAGGASGGITFASAAATRIFQAAGNFIQFTTGLGVATTNGFGTAIVTSSCNIGLTGAFGATAGGPTAAYDTSFSRLSPGVWQMGTTARNALGSLNLTNLNASGTVRAGTLTVATLPPAAGNAGLEINVSDSSVTTFGAIAAGGGAANVKLRSNGTNWTVQGA